LPRCSNPSDNRGTKQYSISNFLRFSLFLRNLTEYVMKHTPLTRLPFSSINIFDEHSQVFHRKRFYKSKQFSSVVILGVQPCGSGSFIPASFSVSRDRVDLYRFPLHLLTENLVSPRIFCYNEQCTRHLMLHNLKIVLYSVTVRCVPTCFKHKQR